MEKLPNAEKKGKGLSDEEYHKLIKEAYLLSGFDSDTGNILKMRAMLKRSLTMHQNPLPEELLATMEKILLHEQEQCTLFSWVDFENINHRNDLGATKISIWKGDICTLKIDGIVNAANSGMLGCFSPNHPCIDNVIHDKAGPRLRAVCRNIMEKQNSPEPTGRAKITKAFCLPSNYVIHTVGPIYPEVGLREDQLASSYISCLDIGKKNKLKSIAFCCISTGMFGFPQKPAALVALKTVRDWLLIEENQNVYDCIVFNVFTAKDEELYLQYHKNYFS